MDGRPARGKYRNSLETAVRRAGWCPSRSFEMMQNSANERAEARIKLG